MVRNAAATGLFLVMVCLGGGEKAIGSGDFAWCLPPGFPKPSVPPENPMTVEKVELGRLLFHDPRLSGNGTLACADCHRPELAFTDGRARAVGAEGDEHPRSAMSLMNVAYNASLGWDDPSLTRLEDQAIVPLMNRHPVEMGMSGRESEVLQRLRDDPVVRQQFQRGFPEDEEPVTLSNVVQSLATYQRTLISGDSAYDRWAYSAQTEALSWSARNGARLFFSGRLNCFRCHSGFNLSGPVVYAGSQPEEPRFHDTGLVDKHAGSTKAELNTGVHRITDREEDRGRFRAPTLRNIAVTAPYMHDGRFSTLGEVIDHYAAGISSRSDSQGSMDPILSGFELTDEEQRDLVAFLESLTDARFLRND